MKFDKTGAFDPVETLLRPSDDMFADPVLFLRSSIGTSVAMLTLVDKPDEVTGAAGFTAQISLLDVGAPASDFVSYNGEVPYLVSLSSNQLVFTDMGTQESFVVPFDKDKPTALLLYAIQEVIRVSQIILIIRFYYSPCLCVSLELRAAQ